MSLETQANTYQPIMNDPIPMQSALKLPFDVSTELNIYNRVYISRQLDYFRNYHCCEVTGGDYIVYGELPDGDKKILFTASKHFKCCNCCNSCIIGCGLLDYECCDSIVTQIDYKRNNVNFYTQGQYIQSGCYLCRWLFCYQFLLCFINGQLYYLRENLEPDNPDFNVGVKRGSTLAHECCGDSLVSYTTQEGFKGPSVKLQCCEKCKHSCTNVLCGGCFGCNMAGCDIELIIEDGNGQQTGTVYLPNGCCSKKVEGTCCYFPGSHYVVNFPPNATSIEKFQIIADIIHFNVRNRIL